MTCTGDEGASDSLMDYLGGLDGTPHEVAAGHVRAVWETIARRVGEGLLLPMVTPKAGGLLRLQWSVGSRYVDVEFSPGGGFEWTAVDISETGGEEGTGSPADVPESLTRFLSRMSSLPLLA